MVSSTMRCSTNSKLSITVPMLALTISFYSQLLPLPWELSRKCLESLAIRTIQIEVMWWTWMLIKYGQPIVGNFSVYFHQVMVHRQINYDLHFVIQPKPAAMHRSAQNFGVKSGSPIELNMQRSVNKQIEWIERENECLNLKRKLWKQSKNMKKKPFWTQLENGSYIFKLCFSLLIDFFMGKGRNWWKYQN